MQSGGLRCLLPPPPDFLVNFFLEEARSLLGVGTLGRWLSQSSVSGRFEVDCKGRRSYWGGATWRAGTLQGVELYLDREPTIESFWEGAAVSLNAPGTCHGNGLGGYDVPRPVG
jgi:hypothetical protein